MNFRTDLERDLQLDRCLCAGEAGSLWEGQFESPEGAADVLVHFGASPSDLLYGGLAYPATEHPNLPRVLAVGRQRDLPILVFEREEGSPLTEQARTGALEPRHLWEIAGDLLSALQHLHAQDWVLGCLEAPDLRWSEDRAKFAHLGRHRSYCNDRDKLLGGAFYRPPEERGLSVEDSTPAGDLYALAQCLLMLTLSLSEPWDPEAPLPRRALEAAKHRRGRIPNWQGWLGWLGKLLEVEPSRRVASSEFALELLLQRNTQGNSPSQVFPLMTPLRGDGPGYWLDYRGHAEVLKEVVAQMEEVEQGVFRSILLQAEPGYGRTRTLQEIRREAELRGWRILLAAEPDSLLPRGCVPFDWPEEQAALPLELRQGAGLPYLRLAIKAREDSDSPWLLLFRELSSPAQRSFLELWEQKVKDPTLLVCGGGGEPFGQAFRRTWTRRFELTALGDSEGRALLRSLRPDLPEATVLRIYERAGGVPLLLELLGAREPYAAVPPERSQHPRGARISLERHRRRLARRLVDRLQSLHPRDRQLLQAGALLKADFSPREAAALCEEAIGDPEAALHRCQRLGLLYRGQSMLYGLTTPELGTALLAELTQEELQGLSQRAFQMQPDPYRRAVHLWAQPGVVAFHNLWQSLRERADWARGGAPLAWSLLKDEKDRLPQAERQAFLVDWAQIHRRTGRFGAVVRELLPQAPELGPRLLVELLRCLSSDVDRSAFGSLWTQTSTHLEVCPTPVAEELEKAQLQAALERCLGFDIGPYEAELRRLCETPGTSAGVRLALSYALESCKSESAIAGPRSTQVERGPALPRHFAQILRETRRAQDWESDCRNARVDLPAPPRLAHLPMTSLRQRILYKLYLRQFSTPAPLSASLELLAEEVRRAGASSLERLLCSVQMLFDAQDGSGLPLPGPHGPERIASSEQLPLAAALRCWQRLVELQGDWLRCTVTDRIASQRLEDRSKEALEEAQRQATRWPLLAASLRSECALLEHLWGRSESAEQRLAHALSTASKAGQIGAVAALPPTPEHRFRKGRLRQPQAAQTPLRTERLRAWCSRLAQIEKLEELDQAMYRALGELLRCERIALLDGVGRILHGWARAVQPHLLPSRTETGPYLLTGAIGDDPRGVILTGVLVVPCDSDRTVWLEERFAAHPFSEIAFELESLVSFYRTNRTLLLGREKLERLRRETEESRRSFENLFLRAGIPLALVRRDGSVRVVNESFTHQFRFGAPSLFQEILHRDDRRPLLLRSHGSRVREVRYSDGESARWGLLSELALPNGEVLIGLTDRTSEVADQVFELLEQEQHFVACELHDAISAPLAAIYFSWMGRSREMNDQAVLTEVLERAENLNLLPSFSSRTLSLPDRLTIWYRRFSELGIELKVVDQAGPVEPLRVISVVRFVEEAFTNIVRHASPSQVQLKLELQGDRFTVTIEDDGVGFDLEVPSRRFGLTTMKSRAEQLQGEFFIDSRPGRGTKVQLSFPRYT